MTDFIRPTQDSHPRIAEALREGLLTLCVTDPALTGAHPGEMLRFVPGRRVVFDGTLDGRPAIFRMAKSDRDAEAFAAEWQELTRAAAAMAQGASAVNRPLVLGAGGRVLAVEHVAGRPLLDLLWSSGTEDRLRWCVRAAHWLAGFTGTTEARAPINRGPWRTWAEEAAAKQTHAELAEIEGRVLQKMKKLSRGLREATWRTAICHGDFHPNNLIAAGDRLTGIDLGGSRRAPIYRDIARFLTHMARRGMLPSGQRRFGVDAAAYEAFTTAFAMDEEEATRILPYLICYECLVRVEHPDMSRDRITHARTMAEGLFDDLRQIA
ncbi:aminoglycoside phosphotransferase family protein [Pseudooceanicola sp. 502str34]